MALGLDIKAIASPALLRRGSVNVIGLEAIRAQTGARWEKSRDSVYARLEGLLSHKLGPTDFFVRIGELTYLVAMPSCEGDDARLSCLKIAYELHKSLLGNCTIADLSLSRVCGDANSLELRPLGPAEMVELAVRGGVEELYRAAGERAAAHFPLPSAMAAVAPAAREKAPIFRFAPIWNTAHEAVTAYRIDIPPPAVRRIYSTPTHAEFREELKTFLAGFAHATGMLSVGLRAGDPYLLVVPIAYDLISAPVGRMEIAGACRNLPAELRAYLVFKIADSPVGVPQSRMAELVSALRPFCRSITIDIPAGHPASLSSLNAGNQAIGLVLSANAHGAADEIVRFGTAAKRMGLTSVVLGVASLEIAECARHAGIHYLCGSFIGPGVAIPRPMQRLGWNDLLQRVC